MGNSKVVEKVCHMDFFDILTVSKIVIFFRNFYINIFQLFIKGVTHQGTD